MSGDVALRALDDSVDQINRFRSTLFLVPSDTANSYIADARAQIAAEKEAKGVKTLLIALALMAGNGAGAG